MKTLKFLLAGLILTGFSISSFGQSERTYISIYDVNASKNLSNVTVVQAGKTLEFVELKGALKTGAEERAKVISGILEKYLSKGFTVENSTSRAYNTLYILKKEG